MRGVKLDLKQRAYIYALKIIKLVDNLDKSGSTQVIANQLIRSATSIGANIVEASAGSSRRDFTNYFSHSLKSANECKFWLGLLRDSKKTNAKTIDKLLQETSELANILASSVLTLKHRK